MERVARTFSLRRTGAFVALIALLLTACGARLTEEQRAAGIGLVAPGAGDPNVIGGTPLPGQSGPAIGPSVPGAQSSLPGGPAAPGPTGPLTASDKGVTPEKITIATIADVSGVQPGLFKSAHQAMQALVAMVNSGGGVGGRQLELMLLDSKIDAGGTRTAVLEACNKAFALVGSMSAFDNGGAQAVDDCKIPDMSAITTTRERFDAKYGYPIFPNASPFFIAASGQMMYEEFPGPARKAAQLWLNTTVTRYNAATKRDAYQQKGFEFIYTKETQVVEANYTPFVQSMKDAGVEFVTMLSDFQSIVRLVKAMRKQNWRPEVMEWDSVVYSPKFLKEAEGAAEGSFFYLNSAMVEEIAQNPEMQLYAQWLSRIAPGVQPDYFGLYAWSAGRLFVEVATKVGADLTREAFIKELKKVKAWGGNGLHTEHNVGGKVPSKCTMIAKVQNDQFVRHKPASGFACNKGGLARVG